MKKVTGDDAKKKKTKSLIEMQKNPENIATNE